VIWTASLAANIGTWMYTAASSWLMTSLSPDPLIVSLVQVAASLPIVLLAIPVGALADIIDRRRFLIIGEAANTAIAAVFAVLVSLDLVTAAPAPVHVPDQRLRGVHGPRLAGGDAAARAQG
jgi:MFS family permease